MSRRGGVGVVSEAYLLYDYRLGSYRTCDRKIDMSYTTTSLHKFFHSTYSLSFTGFFYTELKIFGRHWESNPGPLA